MKILQMIWSLATDNGGPTRSTIGLSRALAKAGAEVTLFSHLQRTGLDDEERLCFRFGHGISFRQSLSEATAIVDEIKPDLIHVQGMWNPSTHSDSLAAYRRRIPIVLSPRGMLAPWALRQKRLKKWIGMLLYQRGDLKRASAFHVTSEAEASHVVAQGLKQPICIVPNGVDEPLVPHKTNDGNGERIALFLARLHPGKGLGLLAEAWARVRPRGWRMVVVGSNKRNERETVQARVKELGIADQWTFHGEADDVVKWTYYAAADLFVLPSASENFGLSIAEALNAGIPVITTKGTPWGAIDGVCGWWIDRDVDSLAKTLEVATRMTSETLTAMGQAGRKLIEMNYSWELVAQKMMENYETLVRR